MKIQISTEELKKKKLFVATPMYGGQCTGMYMKSCLDLQGVMSQYGVETKFSFIFNESLIQRARNYLTDEFLHRSDCTHMLFIDADIAFNPQDVVALLALDKGIIGGPYPKKSIEWNQLNQWIEENQQYLMETSEGGNYIIPMVVHIIHNYGSENISDAQVVDAIRILNEDFNNDTYI